MQLQNIFLVIKQTAKHSYLIYIIKVYLQSKTVTKRLKNFLIAKTKLNAYKRSDKYYKERVYKN